MTKEKEPKLLGEEIIRQQGSYKKVRRYYEGWHPKIHPNATLVMGRQGKETKVEMDVITAIGVFEVKEK